VVVTAGCAPFRWWDLRTRQLTTSLTFPNAITSMEFSAPTNRLVVASGKTVAFIPVLPNGETTHSLTLPYSPSSASIHPILRDRFVTGSLNDEWVRVHGIDGEDREILKGHHGPVHCVEFSPDGEMYASGSGESSSIGAFCCCSDCVPRVIFVLVLCDQRMVRLFVFRVWPVSR